MTETIAAIRQIEKQIFAYNYALSIISLDAETTAPSGGVEGRGEAVSQLSLAQYHLVAGKELEALLQQAEKETLTTQEAAEVRELRRLSVLYSHIPAEEYARDAALIPHSQRAWRDAKLQNRFDLFAPWLEKILECRRRWAGYLAPEKTPYSFWLDYYQPGLTVETTDRFFAALRSHIVPLLAEIQQKGVSPKTDFLKQEWELPSQEILSAYLMQVLGVSPEHCVLGKTEHPFTQQLYNRDVRITTHYDPHDLLASMYSVIHESGHAQYELHTDSRLRYTVLAEGSSIGIHESQSRLFENYVGRSRPFLGFLWDKLNELFPTQLQDVTPDAFYAAVNQVQPSLIRTEADELTYPLHIMVRYELEQKLLNGTLPVSDLPAAWNKLYKEYLGVDVPDDAHGCLQDIHWSCGDIGYFPDYALGTAYAAQMVAQMRNSFDFDGCCASGSLAPIVNWLTEHIWQYGKEKEPSELLLSACGGELDPSFFTDYLTTKYRSIYQLI